MKNTQTSVEIISWRAGAAFAVPLHLTARSFARRLGGTTSSPRCCPNVWLKATPAKAVRFQFGKSIVPPLRKLALALLAFAWWMGCGLLAEDTTNATSRSTTNETAPLPTNAVALPGTNAPTRNTTNVTTRPDYSSFKVIADRSIFDPNRSRRSTRGGGGSERKPVKVESFTLVGTMSYAKGELAFFDGSESQYRKAFKPQDTIAGYKLTAIAANSVKLEKDGKTVEMFMGAQMKKRDDDPWELTASSLNLFSTYKPKAGASVDTSASDDEVLKRLLERRRKEAE
ncbi:MAG: hypothetical protein HY043_11965 [Verrucomicrobia bacterium]|nr:hypothetical protein [Verrucomicrobiota bacterium]